MAELYLDHGAYGAYAAVPTWGVPQDGDGSSKDVATASATVSINLSGATAAAGNTFSVMGATLTCVASGATVNQFNAGSGATLATNLADAINRTTGTATVAAQVAGWNTGVLLRAAVYARATGSTLELMTRAGSDGYNGKAAVAWVGVTGLSGPYTWSGGVGGCWGAYFNDIGIGANAYAIYRQGVIFANCAAGPKVTRNDILWVPARDNVVQCVGTTLDYAADFNLLVDASNAKWSDTLGKKFTISLTSAASNTLDHRLLGAGRYSFRATVKGALVIHSGSRFANSDYHNMFSFYNSSGTCYWENVLFHDESVRGVVNPCAPSFSGGGGGDKNFTMYRCEFKTARSGNTRAIGGFYNSGGAMTVLIDDCDIVYDSLVSAHPGFLAVSKGSYRITNSRLTAAAIVPPFSKATDSTTPCVCFAENLQGFQLSAMTIGFAGNTAVPFGSAEQCVAIMQHIGPLKAYRYESNSQLIDWLPGAGYPALTATMSDGTPWSFRTVWLGGSIAHSFGAISTSVVLTKRAPDGDAARTVTMELLLNSVNASVVTNAMLAMDLTYTDDTGAVRVETTRKANWLFEAGTALAASTADWTMNSYAATHVPRKISIATTYPIKGGSDVVAKLVMLAPSPSTGTDLFVEPELGISL